MMRANGATTEGTIAYKFSCWVTDEVLPSSRRTGRYEASQTQPSVPDEDPLLAAYTHYWAAKNEMTFAAMLEISRPCIARWRALGHELVLKVEDGRTYFDLAPMKKKMLR